MFCIITKSQDETLQVLELLSYYKVCIQKGALTEDKHNVIIVNDEFVKGDLGLAEMAFQMNYCQVRMICPLCKTIDPTETTCGHLTFCGFIGS